MEKIIFECETITPMFISGADGMTPELRPPSIKGALRFWWRAMNGHLSLDELRKKEAEIFGSTEQRSEINIILKNRKLLTENKPFNVNLKYLFFSMSMQNRDYISPKSTFTVELICNSKNILKYIGATFWLLTYFGGLGSRTRRGGGNFVVRNSNGEIIKYLPSFTPTTEKNFSDYSLFIENGIKSVKSILNTIDTKDFPNYSAINSNYTNVYIIEKEFSTYQDALGMIGEKFMSFRRGYKTDSRIAGKLLTDGKISQKENKTIERTAFGLPLIFRFRNLPGSIFVKGEYHERRSSPFIIRLVRFNDKYIILLLKIASNILEEQEKLQISKGERILTKLNQPKLSIIDEFIESLRNKFNLREIKI